MPRSKEKKMTSTYAASECSETTTDVGMSEIFDLVSECGDCQLGENLSMIHLTDLRSRLRAGLFRVEKLACELEKQETKQQALHRFELCPDCTLVRDPRKRKVKTLRELHLQVLTNKPTDLLCISGIFSRLEGVALEGWFEHVVAGSDRCIKCRQVKSSTAEKILLSAEVVNNLRQQFTEPESSDCNLLKACSKCLHYVITALGDSTELPTTFQHQSSFFVPMTNNHEVEFLKEEIKKNKEEIAKLSSNIEAKTEDFQNKNLMCLQNLFEEIKSLKSEVQNSNKKQVQVQDEDDSVKKLLKLSLFRGNPWESPRLAIKMWEENLKLSQTPKEEWCMKVYEILEGKAKEWYTELKIADRTWKEFTEIFLAKFDFQMETVVNDYITEVLDHDNAKLDAAQRTYMYVDFDGNPAISYVGANMMFIWMNDDHLERFLLACLRAVGDDLKILLGLFNSQFALRAVNATLLADIKLINMTTFAELFWMLKKRTVSTNNQQILTYHLEMKHVADSVISFAERNYLHHFL